MAPEFEQIFQYLNHPEMCLGIIGSATIDLSRAKDIDVMLFGTDEEWGLLIDRCGVKFNQWRTPAGQWLQRANLKMPEIRKPVQLLRNASYQWPTEFPGMVILQSDVILKPGVVFDKVLARWVTI